MEPSKFDDLTKALATSTSRRQALQRIGGIVAGSLLAAWPVTQALASGGGNNQCARFCASVFGADTAAAKQCTSDAAHGRGLCYTCGPAAPAGHPPLCGQLCCSAGQVCQGGTCVTPCTANEGTCQMDSDCCSGHCDQSTLTCVSCIPGGDQFCTGSGQAQCCAGLICDGTTATCVSCIPVGDVYCTSNSDCCSNNCNTISHICV